VLYGAVIVSAEGWVSLRGGARNRLFGHFFSFPALGTVVFSVWSSSAKRSLRSLRRGDLVDKLERAMPKKGYRQSEEHRAKRAAALRGKPKSKKHRAAISEGMLVVHEQRRLDRELADPEAFGRALAELDAERRRREIEARRLDDEHERDMRLERIERWYWTQRYKL
jgi:hypothetical protein